jgi:tRNA dimethylallyltransferase
MNPLIAIVGPTAVGKSKLALSLAREFDGEIINADSCQVYRGMDIGTAKPSPEDRALVPYYLIDIINLGEPFSLALYQELAYRAIEDIQQRGKLALLVGGSGLYMWSIIEGWRIPQVPPNPELRYELEQRARREGNEPLYRELQSLDPVAAVKIDPRNVRRIIRALEVCHSTHIPFSKLQQKDHPPFSSLIIGLTSSREELYQRIDNRIDKMIEQGLVEELQSLMERGYSLTLPPLSSIGYKQIGEYLQEKVDLPTAIQQIKFESHRLARHQYAWFRLRDPRIHWFDVNHQRPH